jgi:hypothetical protein
MQAKLQVFTFKAGLLARIAHDLQLSVHKFAVTLQARHVSAWFDATSLRVDGVMTSHGLDTTLPSEHDRKQILSSLRDEILQSARFARVEFAADIAANFALPGSLVGRLSLRGREQPQRLDLEMKDPNRVLVRAQLVPSQFGIAPFKALAGAIKLQDRVVVCAELLLSAQTPRAILDNPEATVFDLVSAVDRT